MNKYLSQCFHINILYTANWISWVYNFLCVVYEMSNIARGNVIGNWTHQIFLTVFICLKAYFDGSVTVAGSSLVVRSTWSFGVFSSSRSLLSPPSFPSIFFCFLSSSLSFLPLSAWLFLAEQADTHDLLSSHAHLCRLKNASQYSRTLKNKSLTWDCSEYYLTCILESPT